MTLLVAAVEVTLVFVKTPAEYKVEDTQTVTPTEAVTGWIVDTDQCPAAARVRGVIRSAPPVTAPSPVSEARLRMKTVAAPFTFPEAP
jgi:hypothetical protein